MSLATRTEARQNRRLKRSPPRRLHVDVMQRRRERLRRKHEARAVFLYAF